VLCRYFKISGKVAGYDKTSTALTRELIDNGIAIHFDDSIDLVPKDFSSKTLVIITPAVPSTFKWNYFMERNNIKKRAEVLGIITKILLFCCRGNTGKQQPLVF
jgi:UDP-N-acetylmuramate--alanine ligase